MAWVRVHSPQDTTADSDITGALTGLYQSPCDHNLATDLGHYLNSINTLAALPPKMDLRREAIPGTPQMVAG